MFTQPKSFRKARRGGVLMVAMAFVLAVGVSGTVLLSLSYMHQVDMQAKALSVRMMAAAEAGIEAKRGRFTLIAGVQDTWAALLPINGWNNIDGPMVINGLNVQVQARPTGSPSTPKVRIRGVVTTSARNLAVEYEAKVAQASDYAVFSGGTQQYNPGNNYKSVGTHYSQGSIVIAGGTFGVEFFGPLVETSGLANTFGPEGSAFNYKVAPRTNVAPRQVTFSGANFNALRAQAVTLGLVFKENTLAIVFNGNGTFTRWFVQRNAAGNATNNTPPSSNAWINTTTGALVTAPLTSAYYVVTSQTLAIPGEAVIFIEEGVAGQGVFNLQDCPVFASGQSNQFVQVVQQATDYTQGWVTGTTNFFSRQQRKCVMIGGTLGTNDRVTFCSAGNIMTIVRDCMRYNYMLNNPTFRDFDNKQAPGALAYAEMFGVVSQTDINFAWEWWTRLTAAQECPVNPGGGTSSQTAGQPGQFSLDGSFAAVNCTCPGRIIQGTGRDLWFCGGNSGNCVVNSGFGNIFSPPAGFTHGARHYDWDWRLYDSSPPFFPPTYNASARFIPGTWRSYEF